MAEKVLKKVEDHLNCSICLDTYTDPKLLQCFHVYCRQCLVKLVYRDEHQQLVLSCPICRQVSPIPARGVAGLPSAFHINQLLEIVDTHKKEEDTASSAERAGGTSASNVPQGKVAQSCPDHDGKELELYCETCEELICSHCALKGGRHNTHDYELISEAFEKNKRDIESWVEPMEQQLAVAGKALAGINGRHEEISCQRDNMRAELRDTIHKLHEMLDARCVELNNQLDQMTQGKLKSLAVQRDQIETTQAQLGSCLDFMKHSLLQTDSQGDVLRMRATIAKQVRELTAPLCPDILKPVVEADMVFTADADIAAVCHSSLTVSSPSLPDPSQCKVALGPEVLVGGRGKAELQAINWRGEPCEEPVNMLECQIVSQLKGIVATCSVERRGQSQYEISYQPTVKGRHQLHIKISGQHVVGSPFDVGVGLPASKLGSSLMTMDGVQWPWGVVINQNGHIIVTEYSANRVCIFNSSAAEKVLSFGGHGSGKGQLKHPRGVAVDNLGNILVVDGLNHRIQKFTGEGEFIASVGNTGRKQLQFYRPMGIAFNNVNQKIYVVDYDRIQVLNSDLSFFKAFGKEGSGKGQFARPFDVACDNTGRVYVSDSDNCRIQVFTAEGVFLHMFGRQEHNLGSLARPMCLAVDAEGLVYVTDEVNNRVSVFTSGGGLVTAFGRHGHRPGEFHNPRGIAVDRDGVVYVCDRKNRRMQLF